MDPKKTTNRRKNTEGAVMSAAEELFLEKGYSLATTTEIARRAGVTHAMLHYYFQTKEQIFFKVLDKNLHELFSSIRNAMSTENISFWENLKGGVDRLWEFLSQHRQLVGFLYDVAKHNPELLQRYQESTVTLLYGLAAHHKVWLDREVQANRCNPITFEQLFLDIATMCFSTYMFLPVINPMLNPTEEETVQFLERRHNEIISLLYHRLYGTCGSIP